MKLLALIPARAGSKRVPNKNIRELGGKPLISWTILATRGILEIVDVLVSTDSPVIAKIAEEDGALVPWLRPAELSTDTATSMAVCMHAVDWYVEKNGPIDGLLLLQPTSPFRTSNSIRTGIQLFSANPQKSVVSFSLAESHPMWCYRADGNAMVPFVKNVDRAMRSQDLPAAYVVNGALYIASPSYLQTNGSFIGADTVPLILQDPIESHDIDTEWDWRRAEFDFKKLMDNG
jgi:CMP-N,N'-diacetyllegionaminic acid synthase